MMIIFIQIGFLITIYIIYLFDEKKISIYIKLVWYQIFLLDFTDL